jgi:threonine/homoserine/homoserine lactone efflux protein
MGHILRNLLWTAVVSRGAGEMRSVLRRARRRALLTALGVALALGGGGFLVAAGVMALADVVGGVRACLIVGGALALVGVCFLLYVGRRRRPSVAPPDDGSGESSPIVSTLIEVGRDLGAAAARNPGAFVAAAFAIGLILGRTRR